MDKKELVEAIVKREWKMFGETQNRGGRASCQDDWQTFEIMRSAQHYVWKTDTLEAYLNDLDAALANGDNLVTLKYAYMMRVTFPDEYEQIKDRLPAVSEEKRRLVDDITRVFAEWTAVSSKKYPFLASMGRPQSSAQANGSHWAAIDNYLYSELLTYSVKTLSLCLRDVLAAKERGESLSVEILKNTARLYGYPGLDELEVSLSKKFGGNVVNLN